MSEPSSTPESPKTHGAHAVLDRKTVSGESLRLYLSETEPSGIEKRKLLRWLFLALVVLLFHVLVLWFSRGFSKPAPPPPVEVTQIDPAKLEAIKNKWKQKGFLLSKDEKAPKTDTPEPKDSRYESDRNRTVEKEMRARQTNVIPNQHGNPNSTANQDRQESQAQKRAQKVSPKDIPLSKLSNFQSLPPPGPNAQERRESSSERRGTAGDTGDQALNDRNLPEGAENMLNTSESVYYTFYARIYEQIGPLWQSRVREVMSHLKLREGSYTTQADVVFDAEGNYLETRIANSAGYSLLDDAVSSSWAKMPRFPNPPKGLIQSDGKIHMGWTFTVQIDSGMNWNSMPPERSF